MSLSRRAFLRAGIGAAAVAGTSLSPGVRGKAQVPIQSPPRYPIIYNWDGAPHGYSQYPQSLDQFLEKTFAPIKNTQVKALFWCIGEHEATWNSKDLPMAGDSENRIYASLRSMTHNENIRSLLERGENPYQAMVQRGHELGIDVYVSIRMNDNHLHGIQLEDMTKTEMWGLTELRKQHPEWCLGAENTPKWFAASWNMAIPEVRQHRFQYIREAVAAADWDGVELDWQRHGFHLPADHAYRLRYTLTDLQRAIRHETQAIADKREKPFWVAVRVSTTQESCRRIGYDLETWIQEGLCDILTAGGGSGTDAGIEVEGFRQMVDGTPIRFHTGFDSRFAGPYQGLEEEKASLHSWFRGLAAGYWERGAHGMYVFNWHANERTRRDLLTSIGAVETLKRTNKLYSALYRFDRAKEGPWVGSDLNDRIHAETPVSLYRTLTDEGPKFHVPTYDEVVEEARAGQLKKIELRIELRQFSPTDRVRVQLDGKELTSPQVRNVSAENPDDPSDVSESSWLVWSLRPEEADRGMHEVKVQLIKRNPRIKPPLVIEHVEIQVHYA